jgi:lysophospholipase L1-like esterase
LRTALPTPKRPGEWHIAVTGGSAVWGWRVRDANTIPVQLQNILRHGGHPNVSVYNFGIEGATLKAELALLERFRETYSIDQVLFYTGGNNAIDAYISRVRNRSGPWNSELATFELVKALVRFQAVHSEPSPQTLHWLDTEVLAAALKNNTLRREMAAAVDYCRRTALHCDFALQPMLLQRKVLSGTDAAMARAFRRVYPRFGELTERLYQEALADGPTGHVFDLTAIFDKSAQPVFQDLIHLNEAGNHIAAEQIAPIVAARLRRIQ